MFSMLKNIKNIAKVSLFGGISSFLIYKYSEGSNKLKCDSEVENRYGKEEVGKLENEFSQNTSKEKEDLPDLPFEMMDEEAMAEISALMENPDLDPEAYQQIMNSGCQPPPFKNFNQSFKTHVSDDVWNGLKFQGTYSPLQSFNFDVETTIDQSAKTTKYSFTSMNQSKTDPGKTLVMLGRVDPVHANTIQIHATPSQNDRISFVTQFKKSDVNQSMFEAEYTRIFDRMMMTMKYSTMGPSIALTGNVRKNLHVGVEANLNPKTNEVMYSYGLNFKPHKKIGFAVMYLTYVPMLSLDVLFMVRY